MIDDMIHGENNQCHSKRFSCLQNERTADARICISERYSVRKHIDGCIAVIKFIYVQIGNNA